MATLAAHTHWALLGAALIAGAIGLDALVRPRTGALPRSWAGAWLLGCMTAGIFGMFLAVCGNGWVALALTLGLQALLAVASNAKFAMLGEPLLFSDLALIGAIFRHPQFYLSAVAAWQRAVAALIAFALVGVLAWLWVADLQAHLAGLALMALSIGALTASAGGSRAGRIVPAPAAEADTRRLGLYPTLMLYWLRWRSSFDPPPCAPRPRQAAGQSPELVVIIQCESFADPEELFERLDIAPDDLRLPELHTARARSAQWGNLHVSGFGAYTMRTEYGVLFGRDEDVLGFRRYDPFLTALREASYALPARLQAHGREWRSLFVHPHDMRFYGRNRIMPAGGFDELVGEDRFMPPGPDEGRYVTDAAMTEEILQLVRQATGPTLLYAVTIENHGPWAPHGDSSLVDGYLRLVRKGDAMLDALHHGIARLQRPAMLVFFGDHRPSIPGATRSGGDRHTPYVILRYDAQGRTVAGDGAPVNLTPAGLHHAILNGVLGSPEP